MRTLLAIFLLIGLSTTTHAQTGTGDSIKYYKQQWASYEQRVLDSANRRDSGLYYARRLHHLKSHSFSYSAYSLFTEVAGADFSKLNAAAAKDGFPPINGPIYRIGIGMSHKGYNRIIIDWNILVAGFNRTTKANDEKIQANFNNFFGLELGYAVVNRSRFDIYPYAGLSVRSDQLSFSQSATVNNNYNSIASIILNNPSANATNTALGYEAGLGIDWVLYFNKKNQGGAMLFAKFGADGRFGNEDYKISGVDYNSGIKYGAWVAALGFKFFQR
jgi:hypothetical protein